MGGLGAAWEVRLLVKRKKQVTLLCNVKRVARYHHDGCPGYGLGVVEGGYLA